MNLNNLIYKYKTEGRSSKDFSNYQNLIDLFTNLWDGNIDPKEVLKSQINFKNQIWAKSKNQKLKLKKIFWFKRKNYWLF